MKKIDIHLHPIGEEDPTMDKYVVSMKKGAVIAGLVHGLPWNNKSKGKSKKKNHNELTRAACDKHKGILFGSVCVDFKQPAKEVIAVIKDYASSGFRSIKLFPNYGYNPSDPKYDKIWDVVEDNGMMCLSHCGWLGDREDPIKNIDQFTARPFAFERAARNHQGINFIMAHFGGAAFYLETCVLTLRLSNFYADTCPGWGRWVFDMRLPGLYGLDFSKILYGTDNVGVWDERSYNEDEKSWSAIHKSMKRTNTDINNYFYNNNAKLLGLG